MLARLKTRHIRAVYGKRKWTLEAAQEPVKNPLGFRPFSLRRLKKIEANLKLVCLGR